MAVISLPAWGSLGGDFKSVQADQVFMRGSLRTSETSAYTVHEIQSQNGTVVREFMSTDGKVFAVAWHGPWQPDMRQVLGSYFDQYSQAAKSREPRMIRRPITLNQPGLILQAGGHLRSFVGRAYMPDQLPAGVSETDIR